MFNTFTIITLFISVFRQTAAEVYAVRYASQFYFDQYDDVPGTFGGKLTDKVIRAMLILADPPNGCTPQNAPPNDENETGRWVLLVPRYDGAMNCSFEQKVRMAQSAGYDGVIVHNVNSDQLVPMSAENKTGIFIPAVFVSATSGQELREKANPEYFIVITGDSPFNIQTHLLIPFAIVVGICFIVMVIFMIVKFIKDARRQRRHRLPASALNKIPICKYQKGDPYETCVICLEDYVEGEKLRVLPCNHVYHTKCIDVWLTKNRRVCPICKRKVFAHGETHYDSDSDTETDDTTPLINSGRGGTQGGTFQVQNENPLSSNQRPSVFASPFRHIARSVSQQTQSANFVTTSDHHSINGDVQNDEIVASNSERSDVSFNSCDNNYGIQVHVHPDENSVSDEEVRI